MSSDMTNGNEDSDCGEDGEIWEEEGGYLVISTDKVILQFFLMKGQCNHVYYTNTLYNTVVYKKGDY